MQNTVYLQPLESRKLFAATAVVAGTVLRIDGTDGSDQITVQYHPPTDLRIDVILNGVTTEFLSAGIYTIQVQGFEGRDTIHLERMTIPAKVYGGGGNDVIYGTPLNDRILGGAGNDYISAGAGNDILYGEAGNDKIFGGDGKDYIYAGAGKDAVRSQGGKDRIFATVDLDDLKDNKGDVVKQILE